MSVEAITWAFKTPCGSASIKAVLVALADHADAEGIAWPCISRIVQMTELNRKTIISALAALQTLGLIRKTGDRKGQTGSIPIYQLQFEAVPKVEQYQKRNSTETGTAKQSQKRTEAVPFLRGSSTKNGTQNHQEPSLTTNLIFERFWEIFPKRAGANPKAPALTAFRARCREGVKAEDLIAGAERYANYVSAVGWYETQYSKQAVSWLSPTYRGWEQDWQPPPERLSTNPPPSTPAYPPMD